MSVDVSAQVVPAKPAAKQGPPKTAAQALEPTRISFECDKAQPRDAVMGLGKVLGFPVDDGSPNSGDSRHTVTMHVKDRPMMEVVAQVAEQSGWDLTARAPYAAATFCFQPYDQQFKGSVYLPTKTDAALIPILTRPPNRGMVMVPGALAFTLQTLNEPKVFLAGVKREVQIDEATDDQGRPIERATGGFRPVLPPRGPGNAQAAEAKLDQYTLPCGDFPETRLHFKRPDGAKSIKRLRGSITYLVGLDVVERNVSNALRNEDSFKVGRDVIRFSGLGPTKRDPTEYQFTATVPRFQMGNGLTFDNSAEFRSMKLNLSDANGLRLFSSNSPSEQSGPATASKQVSYTYRSPGQGARKPAGPPTKFVVQMAGRVEEITVPFEFTDIPLP